MSQKVCCWDCIANEMVFDENYTQWCLWRDVHAMLREDDLNKGYNTRRRPLLGITILHQGGMRMIGKVTCHGLSQFTSPQIDQVRIPQWEVFLQKLCLQTETETVVSKILPDQFTFDWMLDIKQRWQLLWTRTVARRTSKCLGFAKNVYKD